MTPVGLALGWALFAVLVVGLAAMFSCLGDRMRAHANRTPINLDDLDGATPAIWRDQLRRCDQRTCPGVGVATVTDSEGRTRRVCSACLELGDRLGWWFNTTGKGGAA